MCWPGRRICRLSKVRERERDKETERERETDREREREIERLRLAEVSAIVLHCNIVEIM